MNPLTSLVEAARRRAMANVALRAGLIALAAALAVFVVLLLVGTQVLDWYWPVLVFGGALPWGGWRFRREVPTAYAAAQRIDERLGLHDSISTAFYFLDPQRAPRSEDLRSRQRKAAEEMAGGIAAKDAMPLMAPRAWIPCAALAAAALALFGVRYGMQQSLDLRRPLMAWSGETDLKADPVKRAGAAKREPKDPFSPMSVAREEETEQAAALDNAPEDALKPSEVPNVDKAGVTPVQGKDEQGSGDEPESEEEGEEGGGEEPGSGKPDSKSEEGGAPGKDAAKSPPNQNEPSESNSMLDKMRDAFANMMKKLNIEQKGDGTQKASTKGGQKSGQGKAEKSQNAQMQKGKQDQQGGQSMEGQQNQQQNAQGHSVPGKTGDQSTDQASNEPKSGMGRQDGAKDVQMAEQQQAMGKLSEIIGQRNANQKGEIMIEVASSKNQQLKTAYSEKKGQQSDTGAEIRRSEVPLDDQTFVQRYFERVRKTGPKPQ